MALIQMENVGKDFKVYKRQKGFWNNTKALFARKYETVHAVQNISFEIEKGELVGYIGQNGAGKSTTIKMLSGILVPSSGKIVVNGIVPYQNRRANAMNIGVVFGQRSQLNWDLPTEDTFDLYRKMYKVSDVAFRRNVELFTDILGLGDFIRTPVRQLSLGQKMRAEIAVSLLHDPEILYLDEPTIGLDVLVKERIRLFIRELNREKKTTVILTTHDMMDIDTICDRIIMIDQGQKLIDQPITDFKRQYSNECQLAIEFETAPETVDSKFTEKVRKGNQVIYIFNKNEIDVKEAFAYFVNQFAVTDISVKPVEIDEIVRHLYQNVSESHVEN